MILVLVQQCQVNKEQMSDIPKRFLNYIKSFLMSDRLTKRGRPKIRSPPAFNFLKKRLELNSLEFFNDNTFWNKSSDGLLEPESEEKKAEEVNNQDTIAQEQNSTSEMGRLRKWKNISNITLTMTDKNDIIKSRWISDSVVNAAQILLKRQFPNIGGLQNVLLCDIDNQLEIDWIKSNEEQKLIKELMQKKRNLMHSVQEQKRKFQTAEFEPEASKSLDAMKTFEKELKQVEEKLKDLKKNQIHINGLQPLEPNSKFVQLLLDRTEARNHWICVSNVTTNDFKTVRIYDNDFEQINRSIENYSIHLKRTLKRLFRDANDIRLELPLVTQCYDHRSGGLYAIAYAEVLCSGHDPSDILFSTNPKEFRSHLAQCLEKERIDRFPTGSSSIVVRIELDRN